MPEAGLVHALRVVVLVPEQRRHDHRQPEVERLRDGVVAAVRDQQVALREDRRLRQERLAVHALAEPELLVQRAHAHDHALLRAVQHVDEALHQAHVHAAEAAEREVDDLAVAREGLVHVELAVAAADRGVEPVPGLSQRGRARVVDDARVEVQVQPGRLVLELPLGKRRRALRLVELGQLPDQRVEQPPVLGCGTPPSRCGRRPGSRRTRAGSPGHPSRAGWPTPSAPTALPRPGWRRRTSRCRSRSGRAHVLPDLHHPVVRVPRAAGELLTIGSVTVSSCSIVGLRNSGAVTRMNSSQPSPVCSSCSGGGPTESAPPRSRAARALP